MLLKIVVLLVFLEKEFVLKYNGKIDGIYLYPIAILILSYCNLLIAFF